MSDQPPSPVRQLPPWYVKWAVVYVVATPIVLWAVWHWFALFLIEDLASMFTVVIYVGTSVMLGVYVVRRLIRESEGP